MSIPIFSFEGRTRRSQWWAIRVFAFVVICMGYAVLAPWWPPLPQPAGLIVELLCLPVLLAAMWIDLAAMVRRWHDRDKSGWMSLVMLIPILGPLWILIECGFLDGTPGSNRFGPSPKETPDHAAAMVFN